MPKSYTPRGFAVYDEFEYAMYEGQETQPYSIQESSLAYPRKVWVGAGLGGRAHLTEEEARKVRDALNEFLGE